MAGHGGTGPRRRCRAARLVGARLVVAGVLGTGAAACEAPGPPPEPVTTVDSAGTTVVTSREGRWPGVAGWTVARTPRLTVGVREGREAYELVRVADAALQSDGDLVVADAGAGTVRLFGPDGALKTTLGRAGEAPGEFREPTEVRVGRGDSVTVWDAASWRLTSFDAEGRLAAVETVDPTAPGLARPPLYPARARPLARGRLLVRLVAKGEKEPSQARPSRRPSGVVVVELATGRVEWELDVPGPEEVVVEAPWGPQAVVPPLARSTVVAAHPRGDRLCFGDQGYPRVRCIGSGGVPLLIGWEAEPRRAVPGDPAFAAWRDSTLGLYRDKLAPRDAEALVDAVPHPEILPEFGALHLDPSGHLWVERGRHREGSGESVEYLVFEPGGELLGRVLTPVIRVLEIGRDHLVGVRSDGLGVPFVEVYDLTRNATAPPG